jgi:hypothetical protein
VQACLQSVAGASVYTTCGAVTYHSSGAAAVLGRVMSAPRPTDDSSHSEKHSIIVTLLGNRTRALTSENVCQGRATFYRSACSQQRLPAACVPKLARYGVWGEREREITLHLCHTLSTLHLCHTLSTLHLCHTLRHPLCDLCIVNPKPKRNLCDTQRNPWFSSAATSIRTCEGVGACPGVVLLEALT